jgi:alanine racemase
LGYTNPEFAEYLAVNNIIQTITSLKYAQILEKIPTRKPIQAHIKIDTGMGRLGLRYDDPEIIDKIKEIKNMKNIQVSHIITHFAAAANENEGGGAYTNLQLERIEEIAKNVNLRYHCDNSAGSTKFTDKGDFVRTGISIYSIKPDINMQLPYELKPVMTFKSTVVQVKTLKKDEFVSYGCTYKTEKDTKIATICCGYADGYHRTLSNKGYVWYNGKTLPIIGRICMDMFMVNAENTNINVGDQVELFGSNIPVNDLAKMAGTIGYELTCSISQRVPRIYKLR